MRYDKQTDVCIGIIKGAFGVQGDVRVHPLTEDPQSLGRYGLLHTDTGLKDISVRLKQTIRGGHYVVRLSCVNTREEGEAMKGTKLYVPRTVLPEPNEEDDFYYIDLIDLHVNYQNEVIGKVLAVQNFGADDLLEVQLAADNRVVFVPFTKECVPVVSIAEGYVTITPPNGIL